MRTSMAVSRQSQLPGSVAAASVAAKLLEKKKEFEAVAALERASSHFLQRIEDLGDDFDVIADAGIVYGQVMEQWPHMFKILGLYLSQRAQQSENENTTESVAGERLVRVPIDELRGGESKHA